MNKRYFAAAALLVTASMLFPGRSHGGDPTVHSVLHGDTSHCMHVIRLMSRYGGHGSSAYRTAGLVHAGGAPAFVPLQELGDLQVGQIAFLSDGSDGCGPRLAIELSNQSPRDVCDFSVTAVAVLHRIFPHAPSTTIRIDKVCAGATVEVELQLPIESLAMGLAGATPVPFQTLVVAVDSFDQLLESNECNNLSILRRTNIPFRNVVAAHVDAEVKVESPAAASDPAAVPNPAAAPDPAASGNQSGGANGSTRLDNLDLDALNLQDAAFPIDL